MELVDNIRSIIPGFNTHTHTHTHTIITQNLHSLSTDVSLSSDFIAGFCGETEEEHHDTITLLETVKFDMAYMFAYSMRKVNNVHMLIKT